MKEVFYLCALNFRLQKFRRVAQPGSALPWGGRGRWFKSSHADIARAFVPKPLFVQGLLSFPATAPCAEIGFSKTVYCTNVGVNAEKGASASSRWFGERFGIGGGER